TGRLQRVAGRAQAIGEAHHARLLSRDVPAGEDQVERVTVTDETRQANRPLINERNPPATVKNTENGIPGCDSQVAPECEFEAASNSIAFYSGDNRIAEQHTRNAQWSIAILCDAQSPGLLRHGSQIEA